MARWKNAVAMTNEVLGEAVGEIYVARYFPEESKRKMLELVDHIKIALSARLDRLDWMGEETRKAAHEKLVKFSVKIGYPNKWKDYSELEVKAADLYGNHGRKHR